MTTLTSATALVFYARPTDGLSLTAVRLSGHRCVSLRRLDTAPGLHWRTYTRPANRLARLVMATRHVRLTHDGVRGVLESESKQEGTPSWQ